MFASPFKNDAGSFLQGLSFGISGTIGRIKSPAGRSAGFRTDGQQTFFTYNAAVLADGRSWSVLAAGFPAYRNSSPVRSRLGEYVVSTVNLPSRHATACEEMS